MKHKWHEEIKAWADGKEIEFNSIHNPVDKGWVSSAHSEFSLDWNNPYLIFRIVKPWYETIPKQGRLCWVSNYDSNRKEHIVLIRTVILDEDACFNGFMRYRTAGASYRYVTPVTNKEITQFLN